ncbi:unnamed protein product [Toxocara canis]|uniref:PSI_integrin domain-containing protein n=1 Tax=Toxocara canis TaxID=6265 RepID=A0A183URR6_TOXCA|nr:unnamed protein product [Toxocara canis]
MSVRDATTTAALRFCLSVLTATAVVLSICGACECDGYNHDGSKRCNCGWSSNRDGYSRCVLHACAILAAAASCYWKKFENSDRLPPFLRTQPVIINEQEIDVFHELPLTSLTALTIKGDVAVYKITFENFNGTFPPEIPPSEGAKLPYQLNGTEFRLPTPSDRMGADRRPPITRLPPFFPTPVTDIGRQMGSDCQ